MLVLSRKKGEVIMLGSGIEVTVLEICRDKVRLGFRAPQDVHIHRLEVAKRIKKQEESDAAAAEETPADAEGQSGVG